MKLIITVLVACCINSMVCANILTVSNNTTYPGQFSTVQSAVNAATAGDTIYVYPSSVFYGETVTIIKRLVIIGSGADPQRPSRLTSHINAFNLTSSAASGSVLTGLYFHSAFISGSDVNLVDNLVVSDCRFDGNAYFYGGNILIENCIFFSNSGAGGIIQIPSYSAGNIIQDNYIHGALALRPGTNTLIRNNIFASGDANTAAFTDLQQGEAFGPAVRIWNNI
ncbi:MAG TPA: right-handed parallel beta-helix repeat-containing protein, partial [Chitinophagaceae bacterium]|nr:right-handed parallel beta-helix repeat-containing protein [Chitinophagaceae bacterium]